MAEAVGWDVARPEKLQGARITASAMQILADFIWDSAIRVKVQRPHIGHAFVTEIGT
jgi:hypothetical protein